MAESPPPTITIGFSRKKYPSHVAQVDTPCPISVPLGRQAQQPRRRPCGDDQGARLFDRRSHVHGERRGAELDRGHVAAHDLGAEALGLRPHFGHQIRPHDAVLVPGEILDHGRQHELPTGLDALDNQRRQIRPRRVQGRSQPGRSRSDDDHVPHLVVLLAGLVPSFNRLPARDGCLVHLDIGRGRAVPGEVLAHACPLHHPP